MPLITSLLLLTFSVLYLGEKSSNKSVKDIVRTLKRHKENIGYWGLLYSILALFLLVFSVLNAPYYTHRFYIGHLGGLFISNILLVFLATPFAYPKIKKHLKKEHKKIHSILGKIIKITEEYKIIIAGFAAIMAVFSILS